MTATRPSTSKL